MHGDICIYIQHIYIYIYIYVYTYIYIYNIPICRWGDAEGRDVEVPAELREVLRPPEQRPSKSRAPLAVLSR